MTHAEMPATDLFVQLDDLGRSIAGSDETGDTTEAGTYAVRRRHLVAQLEDLDRQHAAQITASEQRFEDFVEELRKLVVTNREQLFPGNSREKVLTKVTLKLRTHYFALPTHNHVDDADRRLITRANNPAGITPRGMESLMKQIEESHNIGQTEQLVIVFNDSSRPDHVVTLTSD